MVILYTLISFNGMSLLFYSISFVQEFTLERKLHQFVCGERGSVFFSKGERLSLEQSVEKIAVK